MKKKPVRKEPVKKKRIVFNRLRINMFDANVYYVCCSRREYDNLIDRVFNAVIPEDREKLAGTAEGYDNGDKIVDVIWISERCRKDSTVISHESFHVACNILNRLGAWLTKSFEEVYAYLTQYIMVEIMLNWKEK